MAMTAGGLCKLTEECGELIQVAAKMTAYWPKPSTHSQGELELKLEDEIGDVLAAIQFVTEKLGLSEHDIQARVTVKYNQYKKWDY